MANTDPIEKYDLQSVKPQQRVLKLKDGREVDVLPPKVGQVLQLTAAAKIFGAKDPSVEEQHAAFEAIYNTLKEIIPAMNDAENPVDFELEELDPVLQFVFGMAQAPDQKALADLGIKPVDDQKKVPSAGSDSLPTS